MSAIREKHTLTFGQHDIDYTLIRNSRKSLKIDVHPDKSIKVFAPSERDVSHIQQWVKKKAPWIVRQLQHFDKFHPLPTERLYVSGETHKYLGKQYRLKISKGKPNSVKLIGGYFHITTEHPKENQNIRRLLEEWYLDRAKSIFAQRLEICFKVSKNLKVPYPKLQIRRMKKRWGSCNKRGDILLNTDLIKASLYCIDYVIMHELCHLKIHNHDKQYYILLAKHIPDWKQRKERLENVLA